MTYQSNAPVDYPMDGIEWAMPHSRLDGKPRHVTIFPPIPVWQVVIMCAVAVAIGFMLAVQL